MNNSCKWFEVALPPSLIAVESGRARTATKARKERFEFFHRFLSVMLSDLIESSMFGFRVDSVLVSPRVLMLLCDQKQEKVFLSLKGAQSLRECSPCVIISNGRKRMVKPAPTRNTSQLKGSNEDSDCSSQTEREEYHHGGRFSDDVVLQRQLHETDGTNREVEQTVLCQLTVASDAGRCGEERRQQIGTQVFKARKYILEQSALPLCPVFSSFEGLTSGSCRLYKSIGFDKLHAFDLGLLRLIPDRAFQRFSNAPHGYLPVTKLVQTVNQIFIDLPRAAGLPRIPIFKHSAYQNQAEISGGVRRQCAPFLWVILMRLAKGIHPDDNDMLQACLGLAGIHRQMDCTNLTTEQNHRTTRDINAMQALYNSTAKQLIRALEIRVNTKLHRVVRLGRPFA